MKKRTETKAAQAAPSAKKPGPKKTKKADGLLRKLEPEYYFYLSDGRPVKSLLELADALEEMDDNVFSHHVSLHNDDFAKWVSEVFNEDELAIKLGQSKSRQKHQLIILKHLVRRLSK